MTSAWGVRLRAGRVSISLQAKEKAISVSSSASMMR